MDTKFSPRETLKHTTEGLQTALDQSLKALKTDKVGMWYLHAPDRSTPYEETLKDVNELYKKGKPV